jgi:hypothetical protein
MSTSNGLSLHHPVAFWKPATLGFVMPGMSGEYQLGKQSAGLLAQARGNPGHAAGTDADALNP